MDQAIKDKVIAGLRARSGDQMRGHFYDKEDGTKGCAVGIMAEVLGYDRVQAFRSDRNTDGPTAFLMKLGFDLLLLRTVVELNDNRSPMYREARTFDEIADFLERKLQTYHPIRFEPYVTLPKPEWLKDVETYANSFNLITT